MGRQRLRSHSKQSAKSLYDVLPHMHRQYLDSKACFTRSEGREKEGFVVAEG